MSSEIDLVWLDGGDVPSWPLGSVVSCEARPPAIAQFVERELGGSSATAWLFWHSRLGPPDPARIEEALSRPGDLWHAGLRLGMASLPEMIDFVAPTWMLNRDPDPANEATSWRLSLEACLIRTEVLRRLGGVRPEFRTLAGAALELGHRCLTRGAIVRHVPWLVDPVAPSTISTLPFEDELRFIHYRFGRRWAIWSLWRSVWTGRQGLGRALETLSRVRRTAPRREPPAPFRGPYARESGMKPGGKSVTILIPTVDRYPYLAKLLDQLRRQTVPPLEVLVVDQTPLERRRTNLATDFPDLPLQVLRLDRAGQCSSRNLGLEVSRGDLILFLDDDDEVPPDLIEKHLASLARFRNDVSSGVAEEDGAGPLPPAFQLIRVSDVFPTNNSLILKSALSRSGLFDLAYDRGPRADADLGMRLYLGGSLMILDPEIRVLHRHAPSGGLRTHGARVITYASSRKRLTHRHLPATTEIYLAKRYFSKRQVREMVWLRTVATFAIGGGTLRRLLKVIFSLALLPDTLWRLRRAFREADAQLEGGPSIPALNDPARSAGAAPSAS